MPPTTARPTPASRVAALAARWSLSRSALWRASACATSWPITAARPDFVARDRQESGIDRDLAAGQAEGVGHVLVDGAEFPVVVRRLPQIGRRMLGSVRDAPSDLLDQRVELDVVAARLAGEHLAIGLRPELPLLALAHQHHLRTAGHAARFRTPQAGRTRAGRRAACGNFSEAVERGREALFWTARILRAHERAGCARSTKTRTPARRAASAPRRLRGP